MNLRKRIEIIFIIYLPSLNYLFDNLYWESTDKYILQI